MRIRLTEDEFSCLVSGAFVPENLKNELSSSIKARSEKRAGQKIIIEISDETADTIRDLCDDQLIFEGFNSDYSLNDKGKILDSLIDKFFTG